MKNGNLTGVDFFKCGRTARSVPSWRLWTLAGLFLVLLPATAFLCASCGRRPAADGKEVGVGAGETGTTEQGKDHHDQDRPAEVQAAAVTSIGDWEKIKGMTLHLSPTDKDCEEDHLGAVDAVIRAQHTDDAIAIRIRWPDATKNDSHESRLWDETLRGYKTGDDREDRVALMFDMGGDFASCMLAGKTFRADVWHWKAARTGPAGLAHDKHHIYSLKPVHEKSQEFTTRKGQTVDIARVSDVGDSIYTANKPKERDKDTLPGSVLNPKAQGSIADIKAAAGHDGEDWTVTLTRKLDTGNEDDVAFRKGESYKAAAACFNRSGDAHHSTAAFNLVIE